MTAAVEVLFSRCGFGFGFGLGVRHIEGNRAKHQDQSRDNRADGPPKLQADGLYHAHTFLEVLRIGNHVNHVTKRIDVQSSIPCWSPCLS